MPALTETPAPVPTTLRVGTPEAFAALPDPAGMPHVHTLELGARLYDAVPYPALCAWIARLPALQAIRLADDWIPDAQMAEVEHAFAQAFPGLSFGWTFDALAGGKRGR